MGRWVLHGICMAEIVYVARFEGEHCKYWKEWDCKIYCINRTHCKVMHSEEMTIVHAIAPSDHHPSFIQEHSTTAWSVMSAAAHVLALIPTDKCNNKSPTSRVQEIECP